MNKFLNKIPVIALKKACLSYCWHYEFEIECSSMCTLGFILLAEAL
jgi:hypothetical protein